MLRFGRLPIDEGPMPPYRAEPFDMFDALVNFDHALTVEAVLRRYGIQDTFDGVIVSAPASQPEEVLDVL